MAYNETGHAANVANFKELIAFAESIGAAYTPPVAELTLAELQKQADVLDVALDTVNDIQAKNKKAIYERQTNYEGINTLVSRIGATLVVLGLEDKTIKNARSIIDKITGSNKKKPADTTATTATLAKTISTSQMSFEQRKNNFERLVVLLQAEPNYKPNEPNLELGALKTFSKSLAKNTNKVVETEKALDIARQQRDDLLYTEQTGAVDVGLRVKGYIKSKYSAKSSEFKRVQKIKLVKRRTTV